MSSPDPAAIGSNGRHLDRAAALRGNSNPRRRQRTSSADSSNVRQTNPKRRKRSALAENTFDAPADEPARNDRGASAGQPGYTVGSPDTARKTQSGGRPSQTPFGVPQHRSSGGGPQGAEEMSFESTGIIPVRGKTGAGRKEKRSRAGVDDGVELTKTHNYTLTRDRSIPGQLQDILGSEPWQAGFSPDLGFAVVLTHSKAIVWKYGHAKYGSYDAGVRIIDLPAHAGSGYDQLPIGTLVHDAGAGDLALLVLMPGGKIAYFESVRGAAGDEAAGQATETLMGSISGAYSNEHVKKVVEAESDGFLLATNMGRLFHLSVRDSQGRPVISTQYLRLPSHDKVGLFGSIRNAITGGASDGIASILTLPGRSRSTKHVLISTAKCDTQLWSISRHGAKNVEREWDLKQVISAAWSDAGFATGTQPPTMLDMTLLPAATHAKGPGHHIIALVSCSDLPVGKYFLVSLVLQSDGARVDRILRIRSYAGPETTPDLSGKKTLPKLLVPEVGHTAFVVFDTKIIIASLTRSEDTPDSQLQAEARDLADNYEECLFFDRKLPYHSAGCAAHANYEGNDRAICDIVVHGFGHVKLAAAEVPADESKMERRDKLVQSRLEQVVFYGNQNDNFLNFRDKGLWEDVTVEDIQVAADKIINDILDSSSEHVPSLMPSMDQQLKLRSQAIFDLNKFVQQWSVSTKDCWKLLWAGEKLASARAIYGLYNQALIARTSPEQKVLLEELIDMIHEKDKNQNEPERGEHDCVRHYLTWDIGRLDVLVGWAQASIDQLVSEGLEEVQEMAPMVVQAADILITALETAWKFREDQAENFGLGREMIENGVYQRTYADMPTEPWTATYDTCKRVRQLVKIVKEMALQLDQMDAAETAFDEELISKLASQASTLTDCAFRCWEEQCRWVESSADTETRANAKRWRKDYWAIRQELLSVLVDMGSHVLAADLAEKYLDMEALALVISKIQEQGDEWAQQPDPEDSRQGELIVLEVRDRTDKYFDLYGKSWAHAFFTRQVQIDGAARMLNLLPHRQNFLTEFLRSQKEDDKRYNRIAWINEVRGENNFAEAAKDLWAAEKGEARLWAKQVGLALTKLSKFAAIEQGQSDKETTLREIRGCTQRIKFTEVQQRLYDYVCPLLHRAIDAEAELQLAVSSFGAYVKGLPALEENLSSILHTLVRRRVVGIEEMIEILTLLTPSNQLSDEEGFAGDRFYWALWMLHASGLEVNHSERAVLHERLIWRRVVLQDDWTAINNTEGRSDEAIMDEIRGTALYRTIRAGLEDGLLDKHPPPADPRSLHPAGETAAQLREVGLYPKKDDAFLSRLAKDLATEDASLEEVIAKGRLEMWWQGVIEGARADLKGERNAHAKLREIQEQEQETARVLNAAVTEGTTSMQAMMLDGVADPAGEPETNGKDIIVRQNGNHATNGHHHHESANGDPSSQIIEETEKAVKEKASPRKTKKTSGKKKGANNSSKDKEGDIVMAS